MRARGRRASLRLRTDSSFGQRVQIVASRAHTAKDGRVRNRFSLEELDGSPNGQERRLAIQVAVMAAIGSLAHWVPTFERKPGFARGAPLCAGPLGV